jgi:hypothetical protein
VVPSPNVAGRTNNLLGIAAISAKNVWAVGYLGATTTTGYRTLIEHFNGSSWAIVRSPNPSSFGSDQLHAVVAIPGTNHLWAAGWQGYDACSSSHYIQPLYEYYDGFSWSGVRSPVLPMEAHVQALAAISANDIWAVGFLGCGSPGGSFIEHWNGQQWQPVATPNAGQLMSVTAVSSTDVWATSGSPLFEHWDGVSWSVVPTSTPLTGLPFSIVAVSANNIWGIGAYDVRLSSGEIIGEPLLGHYDGTSWTFTEYPSLAPVDVGLVSIGVDKISGQVWAAGHSDTGSGSGSNTVLPAALHGNGSTWSLAPSPVSVGTTTNYFTALAVVSATNVWAIGSYYPSQGGVVTLIEHFN